ncbi:MAG: glycine-rich protein [Clostridia bacterium]|nr:glycine-rich protein [Clostridia bacterium]
MKKGISLVALIVTIIVLIIISSVVIINTMNSNVLDNAKNSVVGSGAGGSSFISGYVGCDAIDVLGIHTGGCIHYSGNVFIDSQMSGNSNIGDGLAKITQYSYGYMYID